MGLHIMAATTAHRIGLPNRHHEEIIHERTDITEAAIQG